jgi:hypothetical protein
MSLSDSEALHLRHASLQPLADTLAHLITRLEELLLDAHDARAPEYASLDNIQTSLLLLLETIYNLQHSISKQHLHYPVKLQRLVKSMSKRLAGWAEQVERALDEDGTSLGELEEALGKERALLENALVTLRDLFLPTAKQPQALSRRVFSCLSRFETGNKEMMEQSLLVVSKAGKNERMRKGTTTTSLPALNRLAGKSNQEVLPV